MRDLKGNLLPELNSASPAGDRYLAAILAELQWQREQQTRPPQPAIAAKPPRGSKVEEIRPKAA